LNSVHMPSLGGTSERCQDRYAGLMPEESATDSARPADRPKYHHGHLFEALAEEALERVRRGGTDAVSLRAIAQHLGVSPSAAYHHFPDKSALLAEVALRGSAALDERSERVLQQLPGRTVECAINRLWAIGHSYITFASSEPELFRHTFRGDCSPGGATFSAAELNQESGIFSALNANLDELAAHGVLRFRPGLELLAWTSVHGFACLMLDDLLPREASLALQETFIRSIMREPWPPSDWQIPTVD
ncbi:MAG: TetR/AcrR family transcriptional regulator, partial [Angustibacter sp.]